MIVGLLVIASYSNRSQFSFFIYSKACAIHYKDNPIKIVRGLGTYLYDEQGNRYLDCVNNVTHGWCTFENLSLANISHC